MSSVRFVTKIPGAGGLLLYKHTRMGKICQICFRQRRLSKKSSLAILLFVSAQSYIEYLIFSYDIIFSYYILHHQYIYKYIQRNVSYKRNYADIGLPCNRSVKLPEEASKPSPVHTNLSNQNYVRKKFIVSCASL